MLAKTEENSSPSDSIDARLGSLGSCGTCAALLELNKSTFCLNLSPVERLGAESWLYGNEASEETDVENLK